VSDSKAVGSRWTKAVAMRTPVPKCLDMKRNWCGTGMEGKRLTTMGKEQAVRTVSEAVRRNGDGRECTHQQYSGQG